MEMFCTKLQNSERLPIDIQAYRVLLKNDIDIIHLCLLPGEEISLHSNAFDVTACVIQGEVVLFYEKDSFVLELFSTTFIPKNKLRGLKNTSQLEVRLLMIKQLFTEDK